MISLIYSLTVVLMTPQLDKVGGKILRRRVYVFMEKSVLCSRLLSYIMPYLIPICHFIVQLQDKFLSRKFTQSSYCLSFYSLL